LGDSNEPEMRLAFTAFFLAMDFLPVPATAQTAKNTNPHFCHSPTVARNVAMINLTSPMVP
jgi:hypothetical protein